MRVTERRLKLRAFWKKEEPTALDDLIKDVVDEMSRMGVNSPDYPTQLKYLKELKELKAKESRERISPNQVLAGVVNVVGIIIIVAYERNHAMTTRALDKIFRSRA